MVRIGGERIWERAVAAAESMGERASIESSATARHVRRVGKR
jgi:hypothetical protein